MVPDAGSMRVICHGQMAADFRELPFRHDLRCSAGQSLDTGLRMRRGPPAMRQVKVSLV